MPSIRESWIFTDEEETMEEIQFSAASSYRDVSAKNRRVHFSHFAWKVVALHMITYFAVGAAAYSIFNYKTLFASAEFNCLMRSLDSPWVAVGPGLQFVRGFLFAAVLYPFIVFFLERRRGGLLLWSLFLGLSILGQVGPSPGSLEAIIYTKVPLIGHLTTLPEVVLQTFLFSTGLIAWCRRPSRWKNIATGIGVAIVLCTSALGFIAIGGGWQH
jgi:hypothetical protein